MCRNFVKVTLLKKYLCAKNDKVLVCINVLISWAQLSPSSTCYGHKFEQFQYLPENGNKNKSMFLLYVVLLPALSPSVSRR